MDFLFDENEYFTDKVLTKTYEMKSSPDENDPFGFEGPEIVSCKGCVKYVLRPTKIGYGPYREL